MSTQGMITSADQLTVGRKLWRIYGRSARIAIKLVITSSVCKSPLTGYPYVNSVATLSNGDTFNDMIHLSDFGIGSNYNMNRIFETEEQALAFYDSEECMRYRHDARREDFYFDDYPEYDEYNMERG